MRVQIPSLTYTSITQLVEYPSDTREVGWVQIPLLVLCGHGVAVAYESPKLLAVVQIHLTVCDIVLKWLKRLVCNTSIVGSNPTDIFSSL